MSEQNKVKNQLLEAGIENADIEARLLCERFSGEALADAVARRMTHYPLQYLIGEWGFWKESYEVSEHCLVPRPDTEHLVEQAIKRLPQGAKFLDLCTGSGCVAVSVLASRTDTEAVGVDLFEPTLALAARNAEKNGVAARLTLRLEDVLKGADWDVQFDAILSNPPYIRRAVMAELSEEVCHEPYAALCGGEDGLDFYRAILEKWSHFLKPNGFFLFEIGYDQAQDLKDLAAQYGRAATFFRDYGGNDRVVLLQ